MVKIAEDFLHWFVLLASISVLLNKMQKTTTKSIRKNDNKKHPKRSSDFIIPIEDVDHCCSS